MIPVRADLIDGEVVGKVVPWRNLTLDYTDWPVHVSRTVLIQSVEVNRRRLVSKLGPSLASGLQDD